MIENAAVLVVNNQQSRARPQVRVLMNRVVYGRDEKLAGLHVVIGMLIRREQFSAAGPFVIGVIRLDEAVLRQIAVLAVGEKLIVGRENFRLIGQQIHDLHGG